MRGANGGDEREDQGGGVFSLKSGSRMAQPPAGAHGSSCGFSRSFPSGVALMENGGEKRGDATDVGSLDQEASLDVAEELFVSCRFTEAARVCSDALSASSGNGWGNESRSDLSGSTLMVVFEDQTIAPVGECDTSDLIVAVLLQCGFELQRTEEWHRCREFYGAGGAMPFAVAILW